MNRLVIMILSMVCTCFISSCITFDGTSSTGRLVIPFNDGWEFVRATDHAKQLPEDSAKWRKVDIPHDYSIESAFVPPATKEADKKLNHDELGLFLGNKSTGYLPGGVAWYKKSFNIPGKYKGKNITILFDGVNVESDVWINGHHLGFRPYGYVPFYYDLTPFIKVGEDNEIWVRTDNKLRSRWYPGSGIYRPVKLVITNPVHIPVWGTYITTPEISDKSAVVKVQTTIAGSGKLPSNVTLKTDILDPNNKVVASDTATVAKYENSSVQKITVPNPELWSLESPNLYKVVSSVIVDGKTVDVYRTTFGIRTIEFNPEKGFLLNGKYTKLKGACIHHDNGILGAKTYKWTERRRIKLLQNLGYNAIRCSHNPPSKMFLNLCDELGMLVIDEAFDEWQRKKAGGYSPYFDKWWKKDMKNMLERDRNHPSVIMWSIGNEIPDQGFPEGVKLAKMLSAYVHEMDPTRPTTIALQPGGKAWGGHFPSPEFMKEIDIIGYNYEKNCRKRGGDFEKNHKNFPKRIMYQSESQMKNTYADWKRINSLKYILGDFIWTGIDYIGETGIGRENDKEKVFPGFGARCGDYDLCGFRKPRSYYKEIILKKSPIVHIAVRKTGKEWLITGWGWQAANNSWTLNANPGAKQCIDIYSGCDEVELFLNGKSLGRKKTSDATKHMATWKDVPYNTGTLKAVGYIDGKSVAEDVLKTADKPVAIKLTADRESLGADSEDVAYITLNLVDKNGVLNPLADNEVVFEVSGPAKIAAVGTGSPYAPVDYPFTGNKCKVYNGKAMLIIKSTKNSGDITVKASSNGLKSGILTLKAEPVEVPSL